MATVEILTTQEVSDAIVAKVELSIGQTVPLVPKAFTRVIAKASAGIYVMLYKYAAYTLEQVFVAHASWEETTTNGRTIRPLVEHGRRHGVGDPIPDVRCEALVRITVLDPTGTILAGTQLINQSTGIVYNLIEDVDLSDIEIGTADATVRASLAGAGEIGNLAVGETLTFANPIGTIGRDASVLFVSTAGTDGETEEEYRARVLARKQGQPQGGALVDYKVWGESLTDVRAVYPYAGSTPGEIDVYVEVVATSVNPDGIPSAGQLTAVYDAISSSSESSTGLNNRRPMLHAVNALAITRVGFTLRITGLSVDDQESAKASIERAADAFLRDRRPYNAGATPLPRRDRVTEADLAGVVSATVSALGGTVSNVELYLSGAPTPSYFLGEGELAKLVDGGVTYL